MRPIRLPLPTARLTAETERSLAGYMWADNERLIFSKDTAGVENYQLYGVRPDGSDLRAYTAFEGVRSGIISCFSRFASTTRGRASASFSMSVST